MGYDKRIGQDFLRPGPGFGGSCFPKDVQALIRIAEDSGYRFSLLEGVQVVNREQFERVAQKVVDLAGGSIEGRRVGLLGLTFKAGTDDLRDSPALEVARRLAERGALLRGYDPTHPSGLDGIEVVDDAYAACEGAEVVVVLTEWDEFKWLDLDKVAGVVASRRVVDARNLLDRTALARLGFTYEGIGRR
jgi:UDPglucose 6-dehydrogenase